MANSKFYKIFSFTLLTFIANSCSDNNRNKIQTHNKEFGNGSDDEECEDKKENNNVNSEKSLTETKRRNSFSHTLTKKRKIKLRKNSFPNHLSLTPEFIKIFLEYVAPSPEVFATLFVNEDPEILYNEIVFRCNETYQLYYGQSNEAMKNYFFSRDDLKELVFHIFHNPTKYFAIPQNNAELPDLLQNSSEEEIIDYIKLSLGNCVYSIPYSFIQDLELVMCGKTYRDFWEKDYTKCLISKRIGVCRNAATYASFILRQHGMWGYPIVDLTNNHALVLFRSNRDNNFYIWDVTYHMIGSHENYSQDLNIIEKNIERCEEEYNIQQENLQTIKEKKQKKYLNLFTKNIFNFDPDYQDCKKSIEYLEKTLEKLHRIQQKIIMISKNPIIDFGEYLKVLPENTVLCILSHNQLIQLFDYACLLNYYHGIDITNGNQNILHRFNVRYSIKESVFNDFFMYIPMNLSMRKTTFEFFLGAFKFFNEIGKPLNRYIYPDKEKNIDTLEQFINDIKNETLL